MGKVLNFSDDATKEDWLREVSGEILRQGLSVAVVIKAPDGIVLSAYWNCCPAEKQVLLGHMQVDIIDDYMRATYGLERP